MFDTLKIDLQRFIYFFNLMMAKNFISDSDLSFFSDSEQKAYYENKNSTQSPIVKFLLKTMAPMQLFVFF